MKKLLRWFLFPSIVFSLFHPLSVLSQGVGIGTTMPLSTLDVVGSEAGAISAIPINSATLLDGTMSTVIATPSSAYTIMLPSLATSVRRIYTIIYNGVPGTNVITISGNGANIVSGGFATPDYLLLGSTVTLQNNGTNWYVTSAILCSGIPAMPGSISGSTILCSNTTGNIYSVAAVPNAVFYNWTLPPGSTITAGQGTNTITVTAGSTSGNVTVSTSNNCGTSACASLAVSIFPPIIALDATSQVTGSGGSTSMFTINTTNAYEIILVGVNGPDVVFNGSVTVTGAGVVTQAASVASNGGGGAGIALYACVPNMTGSHTITVTWGSNWNSLYCMAYAASFTGFCSLPAVAANVQTVTAVSNTNTSVSATITPAAANSCLFADYYNNTGNPTTGVVTWTNNTLIRTDHLNSNWYFDGSIANSQLTLTSPVTVTAADNILSYSNIGSNLILAVVHP